MAVAAAVVALATQCYAQDVTPRPLAFPGAEGAGRFAEGVRGGRVLRVTTLADAGPGSLRAALQAEGPRTIIFDVGGTIALESPLRIREGRVTVAGQTAPGGGITLRNQPLRINADDVVIRHLRSRLGDTSGAEADAISLEGGRRIILDHVSASWSVDETLSLGSRYDPPERGLYDVTIQWSIIAESLNESLHAKGDHGYGSLVRGGYGARFSFVHNLWALHRARMPRPGNYNAIALDPVGPQMEFRHNVFYGWRGDFAGYNADSESRSAYAFIGNAYIPGPMSRPRFAFRESNPEARAWFEGNSMDGVVPADPWSLADRSDRPDYRLAVRPDWADPATLTAAEAETVVLARAGARRDPVDARIVALVQTRGGVLIDSQAEVGGWPELAPGTPWVDGDGDGLPDDWERTRGLDPADPADGARDADGDGYTALEDWLNSLV